MKSRKNFDYSKFRNLAISAVVALLAGCGTAPPATVRVEVPVYVPCVTGAPLVAPVYEFGKLSLTASDGEKILALARDWPRGRAYEGLLEAAIAGCH